VTSPSSTVSPVCRVAETSAVTSAPSTSVTLPLHGQRVPRPDAGSEPGAEPANRPEPESVGDEAADVARGEHPLDRHIGGRPETTQGPLEDAGIVGRFLLQSRMKTGGSTILAVVSGVPGIARQVRIRANKEWCRKTHTRSEERWTFVAIMHLSIRCCRFYRRSDLCIRPRGLRSTAGM